MMNNLRVTGGLLSTMLLMSIAIPIWAEESEPGEPVDGLKATLTTQSETVRRGEDVLLELELKNVSDVPFSLYRGISAGSWYGLSGLEFVVQSSSGISFDVRSDNLIVDGVGSPESYLELGPGASHKMSLVMETEYEEFDWKQEPAGPHTHTIDSGRHEISVRIFLSKHGRELAQNAWVGTVHSNQVILEVVDAE